MSKILKATPVEKTEYLRKAPCYPLYGFVTLDGRLLAIEDLRGSWSAPDPIYEVIAPKGFHFKYDVTHTLLCHSLKDVASRLRGAHLEKCGPDCQRGQLRRTGDQT